LAALTPVWRELAIAVPLDPVRGHQRALLLCGETPRQHRWQRVDLSAAAAPFCPVLVTSEGRPIARLEPWARVVPGGDGRIEALWCIEGNGAHVWLPGAEVRCLGGPVSMVTAVDTEVPCAPPARRWLRPWWPALAILAALALLGPRAVAPAPPARVEVPAAAPPPAPDERPGQARVRAFAARRADASRALLPGRRAWIGAAALCGEIGISGDADGALREWQLQAGTQRPMPGHEGAVLAIACSADGRWVASGGADGTVRMWDRERSEGFVLRGHRGWVESVAFSSDGRWVASGSRDGSVRSWDLASGSGGPRLHRTLDGHRGAVSQVRFSAADDHIVSAGADSTVRVWDRRTGRARLMRGARAAIVGLGLGPGDEVFAATRDGALWRWDLGTGHGRLCARHTAALAALSLAPDGAPIVGAIDGRVLRWSGSALEELGARSASVTALAATEHGAVAGYGDGTVAIYRFDAERGDQVIAHHEGAVGALVATASGALSASTTGELSWWSGGSGDAVVRFGATAIAGLASTGDGVVAAGAAGLVPMSRDGAGASIDRSTTTALGGADGTLASGDGEGRLLVRRAGAVVLDVRVGGAITWVGVARGGLGVAAVSVDGSLHRFELGVGRVEAACGPNRNVATAALGPGAALTIADWDGVIYACDASGRVVHTFASGGAVRDLSWSDDGTELAAAGADGDVKVWRTGGGAPRVLTGHTDEVTRVLFTPAGDVLTSSRDGTVRLWDASGSTSCILRGHVHGITAVALDAGTIVSADAGGTVIFWGEQLP
jgi:WD40 repeat protein